MGTGRNTCIHDQNSSRLRILDVTNARITVLILGDQLAMSNAALDARPSTKTRVLMIEAAAAMEAPFHRQRLHLVTASMRRFRSELEAAGFEVDYRNAASFTEGMRLHRDALEPSAIVAMEPTSWDMQALLLSLGVDLVPNNQFLTSRDEFAEWAGDRPNLVMEDFYRWQRRRLGYLMDEDQPAGGRWNHDVDNRRPPPPDYHDWPEPVVSPLDDIDHDVIESLGDRSFGADPDGTWATSRKEALRRLDHFIQHRLASFGPHQDAIVGDAWSMRHSLISPYLNLGLLLPDEVCDRVERAYRSGEVPIASAEGFIRQVIGWREYVNGVYWLWMPDYRASNALEAHRALPPVFTGAPTDMACVRSAVTSVHDHAYAHHIQRLMVIANLGLLAGVEPSALTAWMRRSFIDGGDWVMQPNVLGMGLYADGGRMATKPYCAGGNYLNRMTDHCAGCRFDPKQRTGPDACPFTTLYWDFLDRNADRLAGNHRISRQLGGARRLTDMPEVRERAVEVLSLLDRGEL